MRRLTIALSSSAVLVLAIAGTALGWHLDGFHSNCAPDANSYSWSINLPSGQGNEWDDFKIDWSFDSEFADFTTIAFGSGGWQDFTTPRGGSILYVRFTSDTKAGTWSATANGELCEPPPEPGIDIQKTNDTEGPVDAGTEVTYTYTVTNTGNEPLDVDEPLDLLTGSDSIACSPMSGPAEDDGNDGILDPGEVWVFTCTTTLEQNHDNTACVTGQPGSWDGDEFSANDEQPVEDCDENIVVVNEGGVGGGTGTPAASLPNSAVNGPASAPIATLAFGLLLLSSLGALAFVNVRSSARRR